MDGFACGRFTSILLAKDSVRVMEFAFRGRILEYSFEWQAATFFSPEQSRSSPYARCDLRLGCRAPGSRRGDANIRRGQIGILAVHWQGLLEQD
jgi:hypothetical protein